MPASFRLCRLLAALCGVWLWAGAPAHAAPIDCSAAGDAATRTVCRHADLLALDRAFDALNDKVSGLGADASAARRVRLKLEVDRARCAEDRDCQSGIHQQAIAALVRLALAEDGIGDAPGFWLVDPRETSVTAIPLRKAGNRNATVITSLERGTPLLLLDDGHPVWWQVRVLLSDQIGWVRRTDDGVARIIFVPLPAATADSPQTCPPDAARAEAEAEAVRLRSTVTRLEADLATARRQPDSAICAPIKDQLAAANAALAEQVATAEEARQRVQAEFVPRADYEAKVAEVAALNAAIAENAERMAQDTVPRAEYEAKLAEVAALNATIAEKAARMAQDTVPRAEHEAQAAQLAAANQALADAEAKRKEGFVDRASFEAKVAEIEALNAALSDMRTRLETEFVPLEGHRAALAEVERLTAETAALTADMRDNHVPRDEHDRQVTSLAQQIAALNKAVTDQRADAEAERDRQVSALNATLVDMQIRMDTLKRRLSEVQTALTSFMDECKADATCAAAMGLDL